MSTYNIVLSTNESTVVTEYEPQAKRSDAYQSEAALEAGFHDYSSFYRAYVKEYGNQPRKDLQ